MGKPRKNILCMITANNTYIREGMSTFISKLSTCKWGVLYQENGKQNRTF